MKSWAATFALVSALVFLVLIGTILAVTGFTDPGLSIHGWIALTLGSLGTAALTVLLMGLLFYSERNRSSDGSGASPPPRWPDQG